MVGLKVMLSLESPSPLAFRRLFLALFSSVFLADLSCTSLVLQIPSILRHSIQAQEGPELSPGLR